MYVCVCVCVCVCVRAHACVCVCVCIKGLACSADYAYHIFIIKFMAPIVYSYSNIIHGVGWGAEG